MSTSNLHIDFLKPNDVSLEYNKNGFLCMTLCGESKGRVKLVRSYPYTMPYDYISVTDIEDNEIGIILSLDALDSDSEKNAKSELERRYYCPTVSEIKSIKEKMGHFYFETVIGGTPKSFTVSNISRNMRFAGDDELLIFDMDGNRYKIPEYSKINTKSRKLLEPYLY